MYCPKCYRLNPDESEVCSKCGYKLKKSATRTHATEAKTKYCSHCGSEILQAAVVCPQCGCSVAGVTAAQDKPSFILDILSVLCPLLGFILFCVFHNNYPKKAKSVGIGALLGVTIYIGFPILLVYLIRAL